MGFLFVKLKPRVEKQENISFCRQWQLSSLVEELLGSLCSALSVAGDCVSSGDK